MNISTKRLVLFLGGCILVRSLLVVAAKNINKKYLPYMGMIAFLPAFGFIYYYLSGTRTTGPEVFGDKIWWNDLRPIHAGLYIMFGLLALKKNANSYIPLLVDVIFGLLSFLIHHKLI